MIMFQIFAGKPMKKYLLYIFSILFICYFVYFRWFHFSYSISGNDIRPDLPDFVDKSYFEKRGYYFNFDHYWGWSKKDLYNLHILDQTITDTMKVEMMTDFKFYPYVPMMNIEADSGFIVKLKSLINIQPDSVRVSKYSSFLAKDSTEYYTINSKMAMIIEYWEYRDYYHDDELIRKKIPDIYRVSLYNPSVEFTWYRQLARAPFFLLMKYYPNFV